MPTVFGNQQTQYVETIKRMLLVSLTDQSSYDVRFCAVKATVNYLLVHEKDTTILNHMKELLTPMLTVSIKIIIFKNCVSSTYRMLHKLPYRSPNVKGYFLKSFYNISSQICKKLVVQFDKILYLSSLIKRKYV